MSRSDAKQKKYDEMIREGCRGRGIIRGKCEGAVSGGALLPYSGVQNSSGACVCFITESLSLLLSRCLQTFSSSTAKETGMQSCDVSPMLNGHRSLRCPEAHLMVAGGAANCHVNQSTDCGSICGRYTTSLENALL